MENCSSGSSPDHSWLAFSLSNSNSNSNFNPQNHNSSSSHQPQQLSLFQPLHPSPSHHGDVGGDNTGGATRGGNNHGLSSFLGGGILQVGLFPTVAETAGGGGVLYDSSGSFLGPFDNTEQNQQGNILSVHRDLHSQAQQQQQQQQLVVASVATPLSSSSSKKSGEGFGHRTSIYRGVTRHRWTGRYEAHLWDNSCRREGQSRKGRQVYLGGYDKEEKAARAYDLAALKYWGPTTTINFQITDYEKELDEMKNMTRQEFVASLRRKSSGFSRGASIYRGVTRHHQHGRWQARIGRVAGNKDLYLGTFSTQEEAAEAYDIAAIKFRGLNAVTNFDISRYDVNSIMSSNLPVGGMSNKLRSASDETRSLEGVKPDNIVGPIVPTGLNFGLPIKPGPSSINYIWPSLGPTEPIEFGFVGGVGDYVDQPIGGGGGGDGDNSVNEGYNGYSGVGNVTPSLHSLESPKQSLSVVQTPIFGIE